jgi:hypothetical protein
MRAAHQEEVEHACVDADRHPQGDPAGSGDADAYLIQPLLHRAGRSTATERVLISGEEEQQGVPAEFEEAGTKGVGGSKQLMKGRGDQRGELLGPELPMLGQTLGHRSEPRDVDKDHRTFKTPCNRSGATSSHSRTIRGR